MMKRKIGLAASLALLAATALTGSASAQCSTALIDFDAALAYESNYNVATYISTAGSQLNAAGVVAVFGGALADLDANDPTKEYTFVWTGLTSAGTVGPTPIAGGATRWQTNYTGGTFQIYEGSPRNAPTNTADFAPNPPNAMVPANFTDGTLILEGTIPTLVTTVTRFSNGVFSGSFRVDPYTFTGPVGGTYYNRVIGASCLLGGLWCVSGAANGQCTNPTGYSAHPNGKWDGPPPVEVESSTWGAIKQLYR
jgi:hypothetical protein